LFVPDPEKGNVQVSVRRRRTRHHRRNRLIRLSLTAATVAIIVASVSTLALQYFSPSLFSDRQSAPPVMEQSDLRLNRTSAINQILSDARPSRPVYPYSVVAGGVEDAKELKWVAEHDPIVGAHYAGFNYAHAQVVRLTLARSVYLSYRIGNHIYWTHRRVTLHKGEKLISDGRMTARTRCANRVEESPQQQAVSPAEPPVERFDEPVRPGEGIAMQSPGVPFESAFLNRPQMPGTETVGPLSLYDPFVGGNFLSLSAPPLPSGLCAPAGKTKSAAATVSGGGGKKKNPVSCSVSGGGTETIPEPGTWLLFASGLAAIGWQARRKASRA
jgi:hypothetical protein